MPGSKAPNWSPTGEADLIGNYFREPGLTAKLCHVSNLLRSVALAINRRRWIPDPMEWSFEPA
jgi:hypothetical protein